MNSRDLPPWLRDALIHRSGFLSLLHEHSNGFFADACSAPRHSGAPSRAFADCAPRAIITERVLAISGERKNSAESKDGPEPSDSGALFQNIPHGASVGA